MSEQALPPSLSAPLPELLRDFDGKAIATGGQWKRFRKDILKRVQDEMYGASPCDATWHGFRSHKRIQGCPRRRGNLPDC